MKQKQPKCQNNPTIDLETTLLGQNFLRIIGIDEAGRGSWAGPVAVASFEYDINTTIISKVKDSKILSFKNREEIFNKFPRNKLHYRLGSVRDIDRFGISVVISNLIYQLIALYKDDTNTIFLIDGIFKEKFTKNSKKIIKGDLKHYSISCASIIAKVIRDRIMLSLDTFSPEFGFRLHKGYGTKIHMDALSKFGISPSHRRSYAPIRLIVEQLD